MRNLRTLLGKECQQLYGTLTAYVLIAVFLLIMGYAFSSILFFQRSITMVHALAQAATLMLLVVPLLTMRQFSEERNSGALELMLSTTAGERDIVFAKFIACMSVVGAIIALSVVFPVTLAILGQPDYGSILSGYLGLVLLSTSLVALGIMFAAWIAHPLIVAVVSLGSFLLLWMIDVLASIAPSTVREVLELLSFDIRFSRFLSGAVYMTDVAFFVLLVAGALVLAVRGLSTR